MNKIQLRQPYAYDVDAVSRSTGLKCTDPSLTQQHTSEQTDINYIVASFGVTGLLPNAIKMPTYGDFTQVTDFHEAQNLIAEATAQFNKLPAEARYHFGNDPANLIDYLENNPDPQVLIDLGLANVVSLPETTPPIPTPE